MPSNKFKPVGNRDTAVYRHTGMEYALFYAPGYLVAVNQENAQDFERQLLANAEKRTKEASQLLQYARAAKEQLNSIRDTEFKPECLTLYLNNVCSLDCVYCYANPSAHVGEELSISEIQAGASLVAEHCREQGLPLTAVFHGGGEPTLSWQLLVQALDVVEQTAAKQGLSSFRYIATNGVMSVDKAEWLAEHFDLIGISCDGPAAIQFAQRPLRGGGESTNYVERTARVIHKQGTPLHVRVTITPETVERQEEIAEYICSKLSPQEIHVEPVYSSVRAGKEIWQGDKEQSATFVREFMKARSVANRYQVKWSTSGSRLVDVHGPYCNVFRNVLNLVPGGMSTTCFKIISIDVLTKHSAFTGRMDLDRKKIILDHSNINALKTRLSSTPEKCLGCVNNYHCVKACPDNCALLNDSSIQEWRCALQQELTKTELIELSKVLIERVKKHGRLSGSPIDQLEMEIYAYQ